MSAADDSGRYNGWANYETWAVGLYLDGNYTGETDYRTVLEGVEHLVAGRASFGDEAAPLRVQVADFLKGYVEEYARPDLGASLASDLLGAALSSVDWFELADAKLAEISES